MELQWLLLAQALRLHPNGILDIAGIFRTATVTGERLAPFITIVAKVKFNPQFASERTSFIIRLSRVDGGWIEEIELPFVYPTLDQWLQGAAPYIHCVLTDFEFPDVGEYAVEAFHGIHLIGGETFILEQDRRLE